MDDITTPDAAQEAAGRAEQASADAAVEAVAGALFKITGEPDWTVLEISAVIAAVAPHVAAQALRDAAARLDPYAVNNPPAIAGMYSKAISESFAGFLYAEANRIEADHG